MKSYAQQPSRLSVLLTVIWNISVLRKANFLIKGWQGTPRRAKTQVFFTGLSNTEPMSTTSISLSFTCLPKEHEENCWRTMTHSFLLVYYLPSENVGDVRAEFIRKMVLTAAAQLPDTDWQRAYE